MPSGTRACVTSGASHLANATAPPPMASGPTVGATPPRTPTPTTRSGNSAPQAKAYGPPPESPITRNVSMASASASSAMSDGKSATFGYWYGVDEPMPGRSTPMIRMPISAAYSRASSGICRREPGVPWNQISAGPRGDPYSAKLSRRPSRTATLPSSVGRSSVTPRLGILITMKVSVPRHPATYSARCSPVSDRFAGDEFSRRPGEDDLAAVVACTGTKVDDPVGMRHDRLMVLDDDD